MVHIYEKKPKTYYNENGIEEITNKNVFKDGPCIIVILAQTCFISSVNGAMRLVANLVNQDIDDVYDPNKRIFGLGFGRLNLGGLVGIDWEFSEYSPTDEELEEFVNDYFLPLVADNNGKINIENAMRNIRNINFLTYCDGSRIFLKIEEILKAKMNKLGYSDKEIALIISQICLAAVSGKTIQGETNATTILFGDKNDSDFTGSTQANESKDSGSAYYEYIIDGDGMHDFRKYMRDDSKLSSPIKLFLNKALQNSQYNYKNDASTPINSKMFVRDYINDLSSMNSNEIAYKTYRFSSTLEHSNYLYNIYHSYRESNNIKDLESLIKRLDLSECNEDNIKTSGALLEVAYKNDEVIGFCLHNAKEIELIVCTPSYRKNGIGTELFNNAIAHIICKGYDNCTLKSSKQYDNYNFWISKGATKIDTYWAGMFENIEVSVLKISNISQYHKNIKIKKLELKH